MPALAHVFDGTPENFQQLVVENSHKGVVLVNYWTASAGPCFRLWQVLEGLSQEYGGRFLLVNVNTDTYKMLARDQGITSVPTVKIYRNGVVVESIYGAQSESALRNVVDKYVPPAQDAAIAGVIRAYQSGDVEGALHMLVEASSKCPYDIKLHAMRCKILLREKRYADIENYLSGLPDKLQNQHELGILRVHARMLALAEQAPSVELMDGRLEAVPDDLDNAMQRAAVAMVQDDYATALALLLEVFRRERQYANELPRKAMLVIFSLLGDQHDLTRSYQKQLRDLLH